MCCPGTYYHVTFHFFHCSISPVFTPQIEGGALPPGAVTLKESVSQLPILFAAPAAAVGPTVMVVAVTLKREV